MDLIRAWAAGLVGYLAAIFLVGWFVDPVRGPFWPFDLAPGVAGAVSALGHPWPQRRSLPRQAAAVLVVPLLTLAFSLWLKERQLLDYTVAASELARGLALSLSLAMVGAAVVALARRLSSSGGLR
ncbi:MAG: hypothetical protein ACR2MA_00090 [Egibacteraceae bacterium]